jgi:hypothetical protein
VQGRERVAGALDREPVAPAGPEVRLGGVEDRALHDGVAEGRGAAGALRELPCELAHARHLGAGLTGGLEAGDLDPAGRDHRGEPGERIVSWDGKKRLGKAQEGAYVASVEAVDAIGTARADVPFLLDATSPTIRVVSAEPPRLWVSEAATLTVWADGAHRTIRATAAGTHRIARIERLKTLVVVARDAAGNESVLRR